MRVAAIDCGTNSIRLLIADVGSSGLVDVTRTMQVVRLGQGVDVSGRLVPEAMQRRSAAPGLRRYAWWPHRRREMRATRRSS
jgi:exopolyphosphatase / guanosine-5'-triphosphate,3'-diphosphate pyrophosphatase